MTCCQFILTNLDVLIEFIHHLSNSPWYSFDQEVKILWNIKH